MAWHPERAREQPNNDPFEKRSPMAMSRTRVYSLAKTLPAIPPLPGKVFPWGCARAPNFSAFGLLHGHRTQLISRSKYSSLLGFFETLENEELKSQKSCPISVPRKWGQPVRPQASCHSMSTAVERRPSSDNSLRHCNFSIADGKWSPIANRLEFLTPAGLSRVSRKASTI